MGLGCRASGVGFRVSGLGCRVSGVGCRVSGVGCREKLTLRLRSASTPNFDRLNCRRVEVLNFTQRVTKIESPKLFIRWLAWRALAPYPISSYGFLCFSKIFPTPHTPHPTPHTLPTFDASLSPLQVQVTSISDRDLNPEFCSLSRFRMTF
jgi:hypothetical protein